MDRSIEEVEYSLLVKHAASYLDMLGKDEVTTKVLETSYRMDGSIERWVSGKINLVLAKAATLKESHPTITLATSASVDCAVRLHETGHSEFAQYTDESQREMSL